MFRHRTASMNRTGVRSSCAGAAVVVVALLFAACGSGGGASAPLPSAAASVAVASAGPTAAKLAETAAPTRAPCPNDGAGPCLGLLTAGTYNTQWLSPYLQYTVADSWTNGEDLKGNFLLVPPGFALAGVDPGTSDFVGVYSSVAAAASGCAGGPAPGVGLTADAIATRLEALPGLATSKALPATVGGLKGTVFDITLAKGWTKGCPYSGGKPTVQLITGNIFSGLDHGMNPGQKTRLYLLRSNGCALAIEVTDVSGGTHLDAYSSVVSTFEFGESFPCG
jgi:hypothetical protein